MRRLLVIAAGLVGGYLLLLLVLGFALQGCVKDRVARRLASSLDAEVTIDDCSLGLIRGRIELRGLHIHRQRGGDVTIEVAGVDADMAALGWMVFDRDPDRVAVHGATLTLSGRGALALRESHIEPVHVGELVVDDAKLSLSPTLLLPNLGQVDIAIDHARTGPFTLRSGVSWVFALRELDARAELPGGVSGSVGYRNRRLRVGGGVFGSAGLEVDFELPEPDPHQLEVAQLEELAKRLARALIGGAARDWIERKVGDALDDALN